MLQAPALFNPATCALAQIEQNQLASAGLLCLGIILITAWLLMRSRKKHKQGPNFTTAQEQIERYRQHDGVKNDLESLMVDIEQLAKRLGSQLDAKAIALEKRIDEADLRIAQLHEAMRQQHGEPPAPAPSLDAPDAAPPPPTVETQTPVQPPNALPTDPLTTSVYRLADEGHAPAQIAQQLQEHVGKVELILALRQR